MKSNHIIGAIAGLVVVAFTLNIVIPRAQADGFSPARVEKVQAPDGTTCYVVFGAKGVPRAMDCK